MNFSLPRKCRFRALPLYISKHIVPVFQVGDGTTSVTLLAAEFLKQVKPYVEEGLHPQIIIQAFRTATQLVWEYSLTFPWAWHLHIAVLRIMLYWGVGDWDTGVLGHFWLLGICFTYLLIAIQPDALISFIHKRSIYYRVWCGHRILEQYLLFFGF